MNHSVHKGNFQGLHKQAGRPRFESCPGMPTKDSGNHRVMECADSARRGKNSALKKKKKMNLTLIQI